MTSAGLAEQQQELLRALWHPQHAQASKIVADHVATLPPGDPTGRERGLRAYRSNGQEMARRALGAAYPVLAALIGTETFDSLAVHFWQRNPPARGDLAQWGAELPGFVASLSDLAHEEPYLPDLARTEWALHCAATAPDVQPDLPTLALLTERDPADLALVLSAGLASVVSNYPIVSIVRAHLEGQPTIEEAGRRLRQPVQETAMVWRQGLRPQLRCAEPGEADFIAALQANASLLDSLSAAPRFEFQNWLAAAVQTGLLLGARIR